MSAQTAERHPLGALGRMGIVVAMHAALIVVVARGLGVSTAIETTPMEATVIDEPIQPADPPPRPPEPIIDQARVVIVEPLYEISDPPDIGPGITTQPPRDIPERTIVAPPANSFPVRLDARHPLTQPEYPPSAIRAGAEGSCHIEVFVLPSGRVGDARIAKSTGSESLDRAAMDEAKKRWRFQPASEAGAPISQWYTVKIVFRLEDARR
jgi:periplasmic protein TonB